MRSCRATAGPVSRISTCFPDWASLAASRLPDAPEPTMTASTRFPVIGVATGVAVWVFAIFFTSPRGWWLDVGHIGDIQRAEPFDRAVDHIDRVQPDHKIEERGRRALPLGRFTSHQFDHQSSSVFSGKIGKRL